MSADDPDLLPLHDEAEPSSFDKALRGYDIRQVNDYLDRVEVALGEADARHAEDGERLAAQERELVALRQRLEQAEQRAAGKPEPASLVGERLAAMLRLAEEEAAAIRSSAAADADALLGQARAAAAREQAERTAMLETREAEVEGAAAAADQLRLDAQRDAESMREAAERQADQVLRSAQDAATRLSEQAREHADGLVGTAEQRAAQLRSQADDDVRAQHDAARDEAAAMVSEARRQVEELSRQRDAIALQLEQLRDAVSAAMGPLGVPTSRPATEPGSVVMDDSRG